MDTKYHGLRIERVSSSLAVLSEELSDIEGIVAVKSEYDIDSLLSLSETTALQGERKGLDDFELITFFLIIK